MKFFKRFTLVALLAMLLTGIGGALGTSEAKAMTFADLVGTYRVTSSESIWDEVNGMRGAILRFEQKDGDYVITVVKRTVASPYFEVGDLVVSDMYVTDGVINCTWYHRAVNDPKTGKLFVYNNGQQLKIAREEFPDENLTLRRI